MSVTVNTTIGGGLISFDKRINKRFYVTSKANVTKKRLKYTRSEIKTLPSLSNLSESADAWNLLTEEIKSNWSSAGNECGLSAYNLFSQDKIYRIINNISGNATPSTLHQYKIGHIEIPDSSGNFLLRQVGSFNLAFPASLKINVKTSLTDEDPGNGYVKVRLKYNYFSGVDELTEITEINLNLSQDWTLESQNIQQHLYQNEHWELEIEGDLVHGDLWFDNLKVSTADGIANNDPYCNKQGLSFFRLIVPEGVNIESTYPE